MKQTAACKHRVDEADVLHVQRFMGGNYRRRSRWYRTTICAADARRLLDLPNLPKHAGATIDRYGLAGLRRAYDQYLARGTLAP